MPNGLALLGRVLMGGFFIEAGLGKLLAPATFIGLFARLHLPFPPLAYAIAVLVELGGGILVLIGWRIRPVALVLAAWCVATALIAHYHPGDREQMINFAKNIALTGGFLQLAAWGAGRFSVDRR